jgi:hypothetical protein
MCAPIVLNSARSFSAATTSPSSRLTVVDQHAVRFVALQKFSDGGRAGPRRVAPMRPPPECGMLWTSASRMLTAARRRCGRDACLTSSRRFCPGRRGAARKVACLYRRCVGDTETLRKLIQEGHHVRCTYIRQGSVREDGWSGDGRDLLLYGRPVDARLRLGGHGAGWWRAVRDCPREAAREKCARRGTRARRR